MNIKLPIIIVSAACLLSLVGVYVYLALVINSKYAFRQYAIAGRSEIAQLAIDGDTLIEISENNYAIAERSFLSREISTISVNGHQVVMYSPTCQKTTKTTDELSSEEQSMLTSAKSRLKSHQKSNYIFRETSTNSNQVTVFGINIGRVDSTITNGNDFGNNNYSRVNDMVSLNRAGIYVLKENEKSYSIARDNMPNNLSRISYYRGLVSFVYSNGWVQMKREACLNLDEQETLLSWKKAAEEAEREFKEEMARKMKEMKERIAKQNEELKEKLARQSEELKKKLARQSEELKKRLAQQADDLRKRLAEHSSV